jgi:hypothetical protein
MNPTTPFRVYCYDCPSNDYMPTIVPGSDYGFRCTPCSSRKHIYDVNLGTTNLLTYPSLPISCLFDKCNVSPKYRFDPATKYCETCSILTPFFDSQIQSCVDTCANLGVTSGRALNSQLSYCGLCIDALVSNSNDCKLFCPKPKYLVQISSQV